MFLNSIDFGTLFLRSNSSSDKLDSLKAFDFLLDYLVRYNHLLDLDEEEKSKIDYVKMIVQNKSK